VTGMTQHIPTINIEQYAANSEYAYAMIH
jgi:hypothetical protein